MKTVTLVEMKEIAELNGGTLVTEDGMPAITFTFPMAYGPEEYGIEATEEMDGEFYGFKFFGHSRYQSRNHIIKTFEALTVPAIIGDLLTIERAKELMGKKVEVSYHDYNKGTERFKIVGMEEEEREAIGQSTEQRLHTLPIDKDGNELPVFSDIKMLYNGKQISEPHRCFISQGHFIETRKTGWKKDLDSSALARYIKDKGLITQEGNTLVDFKSGPDGINDGWFALMSFTLSDGTIINGDDATRNDRRSKSFQCMKKLKELFNVINCRDGKTGDATGFEIIKKDYEDWCYEWQGIFRRGSGAERLFIEKILD